MPIGDHVRQVTAAEALAFAQQHNCKYFEAVALRNEQASVQHTSSLSRLGWRRVAGVMMKPAMRCAYERPRAPARAFHPF